MNETEINKILNILNELDGCGLVITDDDLIREILKDL